MNAKLIKNLLGQVEVLKARNSELRGDQVVLIGGYTEPVGWASASSSSGVFAVRVNTSTGALTKVQGPIRAGVINPCFIAATSNAVYFTEERVTSDNKGKIWAFTFDNVSLQMSPLNSMAVDGNVPCYISIANDGDLLCAAYVTGNAFKYRLKANGELLPDPAEFKLTGTGSQTVEGRQNGVHAHCFLQDPSSRFAFIADLGGDRVVVVDTNTMSQSAECKLPAGSGPRHVALTSDSKFLYVSCELSNNMHTCEFNASTGELVLLHSISGIPDCFGPATTVSDIQLHPSGRFVYMAHRVGVGADGGLPEIPEEGAITVFAIDHITNLPSMAAFTRTGGSVPRSIALSRCGRVLIVPHQESSTVVTFFIDGSTGLLQPTGHQLAIPNPGVIKAL
jgi:6-phosphogluconolactonase